MTTAIKTALTQDEIIECILSPLVYLERRREFMDDKELREINSAYTFYRDGAMSRGIDVSNLPRRLRVNTRLSREALKEIYKTNAGHY